MNGIRSVSFGAYQSAYLSNQKAKSLGFGLDGFVGSDDKDDDDYRNLQKRLSEIDKKHEREPGLARSKKAMVEEQHRQGYDYRQAEQYKKNDIAGSKYYDDDY